MITTVLAMVSAAPAWACGGFFCNRDVPVDQSGEEIVFAVDEEAGTVTVHVEIAYTGTDPHDFAWIVPVPTEPELALSTPALFTLLNAAYAPQFRLTQRVEGDCKQNDKAMSMDSGMIPTDAADTDSDAGGGVVVVETRTVGPYETVTLQADDSAALLAWLQDNGYDLPDTLDPVLAPYVASGSYFVALRLSADKDVGDLAPLALTYPGDKASIPIQLTSIAATPDMRLTVYVLGEHRAVPENYLHVQINEVAIDWEQAGANYESVITLAADEAGGHAFATDYSGPTTALRDSLWFEGRYDTNALAGLTDPDAFIQALANQGFPADSAMLDVLIECLPPPPGIEPTDYYNCVACNDGPATFDSAACADLIEATLVEPLKQVQQLVEAHPTVSRLTSSISPVEMTVDPMFVFNPDMEPVSNLWDAELVTECAPGLWPDEAPMRLELPSGLVLRLPSREWLVEEGLTIREFLDQLVDVYALMIEQTGASGEPEVVADHRGALAAEAAELNAWVDGLMRRCGCSATPTAGAVGVWSVVFALGLALRRRAT